MLIYIYIYICTFLWGQELGVTRRGNRAEEEEESGGGDGWKWKAASHLLLIDSDPIPSLPTGSLDQQEDDREGWLCLPLCVCVCFGFFFFSRCEGKMGEDKC